MIRIGTRKSELAQWQAKLVQQELKNLGVDSVLVLIDSYGDANLKEPLYDLGVVGVFTRSLDIALLNNEIDIAVHSMKDVPVNLPKGIVELAVLKRGEVRDLLVENEIDTNVIATSSLRRKSQWLSRYPNYTIEDLRGNVNTRMRKVRESNWEGAIFAKAGLERINLLPENFQLLDWMIPAPAQGALMITGRIDDFNDFTVVKRLNDETTNYCVSVERRVLQLLEGGCTAPVAVNLFPNKNNELHVRAGVYSLDGKEFIELDKIVEKKDIEEMSQFIFSELKTKGAIEIMSQFKARG